MRLSTTLGLLVAAIGSTSLLSSCLSPATIAAVTLSTVTVRANAEHGLASVATPRSKQEPWHAHDDKPPLRSGDDDRSIPDRRVIKKAHLLMHGDIMFRHVGLWLGLFTRCLQSHRSLLLENLALRQQLAVLKRKHPRHRIGAVDKIFWVFARRFWGCGSPKCHLPRVASILFS